MNKWLLCFLSAAGIFLASCSSEPESAKKEHPRKTSAQKPTEDPILRANDPSPVQLAPDKFAFDWNEDGVQDTMVFASSSPKEAEKGKFNTVKLYISGLKPQQYVLNQDEAYLDKDPGSRKFAHIYKLIPGQKPFLFLYTLAYRDPGHLMIFYLTDNKINQLFSERFNVTRVTDINKDGTPEIIGTAEYAVELSDDPVTKITTYNPELVLRVDMKNGEPVITRDDKLSEYFNKEVVKYPWLGLSSPMLIFQAHPDSPLRAIEFEKMGK